ncbi:MAG: class I SAM-dependent rRNA methyltransferase [Anaerolineae bacterium]
MLSHIPGPTTQRVAVHVTPAAERAIRQGHPWLFDRAIRQQSREGRPGDLAVVFDRQRRFLAVGLYDPHSPIRVRVLQRGEPATINRDWFQARLVAAVQIRASLQKNDTTGYRLVHGENDGLPGLVVDQYEQTLVLKLYTPAWLPHLRDVLSALTDVVPAERLVLRLGRAMQEQPQHLYGLSDGTILFGPDLDGPIVFRENGLRFEVDPIHGQKTGFFLDQRENRARVEELAFGKTVLNVFAYTGGFSLYAARGGARAIVSVDVSRPALEAAVRNFALNRDHPSVAAVTDMHEVLTEDAFEALARLGRSGRRFDLVIVDPPAFARKQAEVERALLAYGRLTRLGLGVLQPGGTLVMASCSSRVSADEFFATVHRAAAQTGRPLREIERTGHPLDHPIGFKEGAYLKCLFATVP